MRSPTASSHPVVGGHGIAGAVSSAIVSPYLAALVEANLAASRRGRHIGPRVLDENARRRTPMGLIDFVVNAGKKLFGAGDAAAAPTNDPDVLSKRASALESEVMSLGLPVKDLKIKVAEQTAYVKGTVPTRGDA